jgi:methionyl-tRNA synthetase
MTMPPPPGPPDVAAIIRSLPRPSRQVVTAGMPYANGPLHLGHLAGAHLPADIYARWCRMVIGAENVLFVCGTDDHGSTSELAAAKAGVPVAAFLAGIHAQQRTTLARYGISLDTYSGTSRPECFPLQTALCQELLTRLHANGLLAKRTSRQWYDAQAQRFLPDRYVRGTCPNPKCGNTAAYSDECEACGHQHEPAELINPVSALTGSTPEMRDTAHWWLDMWQVGEPLRQWIAGKAKTWRPAVLAAVSDTVAPALRFANTHEDAYKALKATLPPHKSKYAPGKQVVVQFADRAGLAAGRAALTAAGIPVTVADEWAHRSITRDITWGVPLPDLDPELRGKTLYVWPDSLIAPIAFTQVALAQSGRDPNGWRAFWTDPQARVTQFLGQDNVFFYVIMQGALWLGSQADITRQPIAGELQLTDIIGNCHLLVAGEKMSKSTGNFFTGDQLLDERGCDADQVRYYLALLGLAEKPADFDLAKLAERNAFLAGPMNAAFEKPLSACHAKFGGVVPKGKLLGKIEADTARLVQRYVKAMARADYPNLLFEIENYARTVNSLFAQHKPHDDRFPEEARRDALYSSFYVLKNLMLLLSPFVPTTMERLRRALNLPETVWRVEELGTSIPAGHRVGAMERFFPAVADTAG